MKKVSNLLLKTSCQLFNVPSERQVFVDALVSPQPFHPAILWTRSRPAEMPFNLVAPLPWQPEFVDRLALDQQPSQHPLHQAGEFYCLDFSSVFVAMPMCQLASPPAVLIDVCAAPGGQTIFAWRSLQPLQLLSNEPMSKRIGALITNLQRAQIKPVFALRSDSNILAEVIPQTAQVVVVNAPCSRQTLLAKGGESPGCFHPVNIAKNATRQKRILANAAQLVAPQGHLVYSTKTYTPDENERVVEWFLAHYPQFQPIVVERLTSYQSSLTNIPSYRLFPQSGLGAGAFTVLLQNTQDGVARKIPATFFEHPSVTLL
ncbi:RsmB/NOP family class I SAM-dependent RNA methyltransferase [filamentous cyanobacterium LEGE 11480]|uniref:RsmB/NOP family class I SAM-dependent RNA methyltransferase n=1 Tax=Romeriopsis navalis LEGE 11480 TaxID=2777977 RepID=A0A928VRE0_9CYAN|nr:RsmB/NOP family class I SAM-dependent RNA methyltransferase [Romeriopsis navalis]MBE9031571.1 RsmB/NOP family class I SAM-dependent RNA methyltransferase [Romeriopsis navalis LEGE 11480]